MGRCCRAEHICGLTEFIEDVVGGGGGGTPGTPVNSVQYNSAGAFAGSSNLTYDGTSLKVTGQIQFNGTSNLYPMFKASSATTTELQARLADDTDLTEFRSKFLYAGPTTGAVRLSAAGQGIAVLTNNAGSDLARLCLGGSTSLFPALKRSGADVHLRLADDSAFANLQLGNLNVATITNGTLTGGSSPALNVTQTWNNAATTFTGALINVTDTASNAASKLLDLQTGASSRAYFDKGGVLTIPATSTNRAMLKFDISGSAGLGGGTTRPNSMSFYSSTGSEVVRMEGTVGGLHALGPDGFWLGTDVNILRDAADILALRRSTNANHFRVYETFTNSTDNFSRGVFGFRDASGNVPGTPVLRIGTEKGSLGGTARDVAIITDGTERLTFAAAGGQTAADGHNMAFGTSTGTKIGTATGQKIGFWNATPVVQQVLATGAGATVDNVITLLQTLGLCKQS